MALAAPVGIVQLNDASQRLGIIALDHGLHQFVLDQPGGVGVDAQLPVQAQGRDAVLVPWGLPLVVLGQQVDRQEPDAQRHVGVGARELGAVTQAFARATARAGIEGVRIHDLRHEATSRLFERGVFDSMEVASITGHKDLRMLKRYYHPRAKDLAKKLG